MNYRKLILLGLDAILINAAVYIALVLRFDRVISAQYIEFFVNTLFITTPFKLFIYQYFKLYNSLWAYASIDEMVNIFLAVTVGSIADFLLGNLTDMTMPRSVYAISFILTLFFIGGTRLALRVRRSYISNKNEDKSPKIKVLIYGAGAGGAMLLRELKTNGAMTRLPVIIVDDDKKKHGSRLYGVPVAGGRNDLERIVEKYAVQEIIFAIPSASGKTRSEILSKCKKTSCRIKIYHGAKISEEDSKYTTQLRDVNISDLLGREEVKLDTEKISGFIKGETVLVTGGGGSIGAELCREVARYKPGRLLVLDQYENSAYELEQDLAHLYINKINHEVIIASVTDEQRIKGVFSKYRPSVVFHAAAHKHVPLMESNVCAAVTNNIFGTLNIARLADQYGAKSFVLVSTDKAVNPTSVMGATKRVAEMLVQSLNRHSETEFVAVRFGNVLGSNGSVIPLFQKQIGRGGPVTVTHPAVTRYFMSIKEAVQLIIQAGAIAQGGEIFILDMGECVRIDSLARDLITLSGFLPEKDIRIDYTGLRPGEKLFEELLLFKEGTRTTSHDKIFVAEPLDLNFDEVLAQAQSLMLAGLDENEIRQKLMSLANNGRCEMVNEIVR